MYFVYWPGGLAIYPASTRNCTFRRIVALACILCNKETNQGARVAVKDGSLRLSWTMYMSDSLARDDPPLANSTPEVLPCQRSRRYDGQSHRAEDEPAGEHLGEAVRDRRASSRETDHRQEVYSSPTLSSLCLRQTMQHGPLVLGLACFAV